MSDISKAEKTDHYIAIVVVILFGIFSFQYGSNIPSSKDVSASTKVPLRLVIKDIPYVEQDVSTLEDQSVELSAAYSDTTHKKGVIENNAIIVSDSTNKVSTITTMDSSYIMNDTIDNDILLTPISSYIDTLDSSVSSETKYTVDEVEIEEQPQQVTPNCIIVIGAYRRLQNVENLKTRLTSDGYVPLTIPYRGTTRVAISTTCNKELAQKTLEIVKKEYAKDAVFLVPE